MKLYKTALSRGGNTVDGSSSAEEKQVSGRYCVYIKERLGDFTTVSFLLNNGENYLVSAETEPLAIYLQEGDEVILTYGDTGEQFLPVRSLIIKDYNKRTKDDLDITKIVFLCRLFLNIGKHFSLWFINSLSA